MNDFVQDPGIQAAYRAFEKDANVQFIIQPTKDVVVLTRKIWENLRAVGNKQLVSGGIDYVYARMNKEEFDSVILPLIESKEIRHVHVDRKVGM